MPNIRQALEGVPDATAADVDTIIDELAKPEHGYLGNEDASGSFQLIDVDKGLQELPGKLRNIAKMAQGATGDQAPTPVIRSRGDPNEGINGNDYCIERNETCAAIYNSVKQTGYMFVQASRESGRTSLLQLLGRYCKRQNIPHKYINCRLFRNGGSNMEFDRKFKETVGSDLQELLEKHEHLVLLMDSVHVIFNEQETHSTSFWKGVRLLAQNNNGPLVVLSATYGARRSGAISDQQLNAAGSSESTDSQGSFMPVGITGPECMLTLEPRYDGLSLAFNRQEFDMAFELFCSIDGFEFQQYVPDHIYNSCSGQAGLVMCSFWYLRSHIKREPNPISNRSKYAMYKLTSDEFVGYLSHLRSLLSFGRASRKEAAMALLRRLIWSDYINVEVLGVEQKAAARRLHRCGIVQIDLDNRMRFTSLLHKVWYLRRHFNERVQPDSVIWEFNLWPVLQMALERMDPYVLSNTVGTSKRGRRLEAVFEAEMYRVLMSATYKPAVVFVQADKALGASGAVNIYVSAPYNLALVCVKEGDSIQQHTEQFREGGEYYPLVQSQGCRQWAVIDLRPHGTQAPEVVDANLYTVCLNQDASVADVFNNGKGLGQFHIAGTADSESRDALQVAAVS